MTFTRRRTLAIATVAVLVLLPFAGCVEKLTPASLSGKTGKSTGNPADGFTFTVSPDHGDANTEFAFDASAAASPGLTLTWDFGDGKTATGPKAKHTYGFTNGVLTVTLRASDATGLVAEAQKDILLGSGQNALPKVSLEASSTWAEIHKEIKFSAANTTDADGDALTFLWTYKRVQGDDHGDDGGHAHMALVATPMTPGGEHASHGGSANSGEEFMLEGRGPEVTHAFPETGFYAITVRATDPKGGQTAQTVEVAVTAAMPPRTFDKTWEGIIAVGNTGQGLAKQSDEQTGGLAAAPIDGDVVSYFINFPGTTTLTLNWTDDTPAGLQDLDVYVYDADGNLLGKAETRGPGNVHESLVFEQPAKRAVKIVISAYTGAAISYVLNVHADLHIQPQDLMSGNHH